MSGIAVTNEQLRSSPVKEESQVDPDFSASGGPVTHLDLVRLVERVHRRYLDLLRTELTKLNIDDVSPAQVMLLFTIGSGELSVKDILERGNYLGSNASYNLKHLLEVSYIEREASARDRRSARIRLGAKGQELCRQVMAIDAVYHGMIARTIEEAREVEAAFRTLRRIELTWMTAMRYSEDWR
jgi:DNA-binding MarR family transcriptional regulator